VPPSGTPGTPGTLVKLDVERLLATEPEPLDWLVDGIVVRGALTLLSGREKQGKSLFLLALAACAASGGGSVAGIDVKGAGVVVVDAENGEREVQRRLHLLGLSGAGSLSVFETRGHDLRKNLAELEGVLDAERPDLVVLDSWRSLWGGDENDAGEVARCLDPLRELIRRHNCGAALIHHLSRAGAYRGSTAIGASVENLLELARHDDDDDRRRRKLTNSACRFDQEAEDRWLRLEQDLQHKRLYVEQAEPFRPQSGARESTKEQLLATLDGVMSWPDWARAAGQAPKSGTARRARDELATEGQVRETPGGWISSGVAPGQQALELEL
jgi:RecA-family ATPase